LLHLLIAYFLNNISAKYYENPIMLSRVIAKNVGDVFETQCTYGQTIWGTGHKLPVILVRGQ